MQRCFPLLLLAGFLALHPCIISAQSPELDRAANSQTTIITRDFPVSPEFRSAIQSRFGVTGLDSTELRIPRVWDYLKTEGHIPFPNGASVHFHKGPNLMTVENTKESLDAVDDLLKELSSQKQIQPVPGPSVPKVISYGPSPRAGLWRKRMQEIVLPKVDLENTSLQKAAGILAKLAQDQEARPSQKNAAPIAISIEPWIAPPESYRIPGLEAPPGFRDPTRNSTNYSATKVSLLDAITAIAGPLGYYVHFQDEGVMLKASPQYFARRYLLSPNAIDTNPKPEPPEAFFSRLSRDDREYADRPRPKLNLPSRTLLLTETEERHREIEALLKQLWQDYYAAEKTGADAPKAGSEQKEKK